MLKLRGSGPRLCDGFSRRDLLTAGGLGALGLSAGMLPAAAQSTNGQMGAANSKAKRCIVLFLTGGPPQHSTWDPKPDNPEEIRGAYSPISTSVPGTQICELLPKTSRLMHHVALLRGVSTGDNAHSSSGYAMLTGRPHQPMNFENANPGAPNDWPTLGAVVQHLHKGTYVLPPAVRMPQFIFNTDRSVWPGQDSGFLGSAADPWLFEGKPASSDFRIPEFELGKDVSLDRLQQRTTLLKNLDRRLGRIEDNGGLSDQTEKNQQAFRVLRQAHRSNAFDLTRESQATRSRYGMNQFGQSVLLSRRLIEADVKLVQVNWFRASTEPDDAPSWDSHARETPRLKSVLCPPFDAAYSALLQDLIDRDLLQETLVVCMAEFGRSPKMNRNGGRDHWGSGFSIAMAGGGIVGGALHGATDRQGGQVTQGLVRPSDITATIFKLMGFAPTAEIHDQLGRPFPISDGRVIHEIINA